MNWRIGRVGKLFAPSYGWCLRCQTPWAFVPYHSTDWGSKGCIALCEKCWHELSLHQRLPYYRQLVEQWHERPDLRELSFEAEWQLVERAVLDGR